MYLCPLKQAGEGPHRDWWQMQANQSIKAIPFPDLEDYSDLRSVAIIDEAGPSSPRLKENLRPVTGRIVANTRAQPPQPGLSNMRSMAEPAPRGSSGAGSFSGRLRSLVAKSGAEQQPMCGSVLPPSAREPIAGDPLGRRQRKSSHLQKRKAEQVPLGQSPVRPA